MFVMARELSKFTCYKPKPYRNDVIATARASGCVLQFWNALLVGDALTLIGIVDDDEFTFLIDSVYDTSNIEDWKNFRFNYRGLSRSSGTLGNITMRFFATDCDASVLDGNVF